MSIRTRILLLALLPALAVGAATLGQGRRGNEEGKKVETKKLPLDSIYSTNGQKPLKPVSAGSHLKNDGTKEYALAAILREFQAGASNVFLARGDNIDAAVWATLEVFTRRYPVDEPVSSGRSKSDQFWLVVFFGVTGSDAPAWLVKSAEVKGKEIRLTYAKQSADTHDEHHYLVWVPLGKLQPGVYRLELFDEGQQEVTLLRRIAIPN